MIVFCLALLGYIYHRNNIQVAAHRNFIKVLKAFNAPIAQTPSKVPDRITFVSENEKWESVNKQFSEAYENNKSSSIASMFRVFQGEALINLNKLDQAIDCFFEAIKIMPNGYLKEHYRMKLVLMQLDSKNKSQNIEGLKTLEQLALNHKSVVHDKALYYLGLYFWITKKFDAAKNYWQQFLVKYGDEKHLEEEIKLAKSKLDLVTI